MNVVIVEVKVKFMAMLGEDIHAREYGRCGREWNLGPNGKDIFGHSRNASQLTVLGQQGHSSNIQSTRDGEETNLQ